MHILKEKLNKGLAILLAANMLLSLLPVSAFAEAGDIPEEAVTNEVVVAAVSDPPEEKAAKAAEPAQPAESEKPAAENDAGSVEAAASVEGNGDEDGKPKENQSGADVHDAANAEPSDVAGNVEDAGDDAGDEAVDPEAAETPEPPEAKDTAEGDKEAISPADSHDPDAAETPEPTATPAPAEDPEESAVPVDAEITVGQSADAALTAEKDTYTIRLTLDAYSQLKLRSKGGIRIGVVNEQTEEVVRELTAARDETGAWASVEEIIALAEGSYLITVTAVEALSPGASCEFSIVFEPYVEIAAAPKRAELQTSAAPLNTAPAAKYTFPQATVYLKDIVAAAGISIGNNSKLSVDSNLIRLSETTVKKNNLNAITLTASDYFEQATLTITKNKNNIQTVTLSYPKPAQGEDPEPALVERVLPEDALWANDDLYLTGKMPANAVVEAEPITVEVDGEYVIAAYDIKIYANANQQRKGKTWQPAGDKVQVHFFAAETNDKIHVYHMADGASKPELVDTVTAQNGWVEFDAAHFSAYSFSFFEDLFQHAVSAARSLLYKNTVYENDEIILTGNLPRNAVVEATKVDVQIEGESPVVAYDIKIYQNSFFKALGVAWQPSEGAVTVQIKSDALTAERVNVYHMETVNAAPELVREDLAVDNASVSFDASAFSVYAITDDTYFYTYRFYTLNEYGEYTEYALNTDNTQGDGASTTFTQKVKNGEAVVAPQSLVNPSEPDTTFIGWFVGTQNGNELLLEDTPFDFDHLPQVNENAEIHLYAKFSTFVYAVFHGQYDSETGTYPVIATRRGELTGAGTGSTEIAINDLSAGYDDGTGQPLQNMIFYGWSYTPVQVPGEGLGEIIADSTITIAENTDLYPLYRAVRWLSFSSGSHATYYGPEYHYVGTGRTELPVPEREGYTFNGWYAGAVVDENGVILNLDGDYTASGSGTTYPRATKISNAAGTLIAGAADDEVGISVQGGHLLLSKNATLYANWSAAQVNYSIVIWTQQSFGSDIYDFREQFTLQAATGASVSVPEAYTQLASDEAYNELHSGENVSGESNPYFGFAYDGDASDTTTKVVDREGTTVLNVYYKLTSDITTPTGPFSLTFKDSETSSPSASLMTGSANGIVRSDIAAGTTLTSYYIPADPASGREGYTFSGWFLDPTCTVRVFFERNEDYTSYAGHKLLYPTMPATDLTVYAGWVKIKYLVQIDPNYGSLYWDNGNSGTGATWFTTDYGELISEYPHVTREYEESPSGTFYYVNHDYEWFQAHGGDRKTYYTEDISLATEYTTFKYSPNTYQYDGWYEVDPETGEETLYDFSTPVTHDTYLKLHWRKAGLFYVDYNPVVTVDGVTLAGTLNREDDTSLEGMRYADQANVTVMRSAIAPEGYNFVGWKIRGDESNTLYYPSQAFQLQGQYAVTLNGRETVMLDAVYVRVATASIVYNANGGSISAPDYGKPADNNAPPPATWCDDESATIANLVNNSGIVLSGGKGFDRNGATLAGWNTEPDGSGDHFDLVGTYNVDTSGDPTLYAEWKVKIYFDKNSADAQWGSGWEEYTPDGDRYYTEAYINAKLAEPAATPTHPSRNFEHWSQEPDGAAYRFSTEHITGEMMLYACWTDDLLVPFQVVEISGEDKIDRNAWKIQSAFKLSAGASITDFTDLSTYIEAHDGYTVYACVSDEMANVSDAVDRQITAVANDNGEAKVTYQNGTTVVLPAGQEIFLVYVPIIPTPVTVQIRYVKEGANGHLSTVHGSTNGGTSASSTITYGYAPVTLNGVLVKQDQKITVGATDFRFGQESTAYFNIPPILDDGVTELDLVYNRIGVGDSGATNISAIAGKSTDLTLHLQIRDLQLKWSFDGQTWTSFDAAQPTVYAIYRESGYELEIRKTIPTTTWTSKDQEFTLTLSSLAITSESYHVEGTGYDTITAVPRVGDTPGSIELTIKDGSRIKLVGLPRGDYSITESGNENYTLSAKAGASASSLSDVDVNNSSIRLQLSGDTRVELTNDPDAICMIGNTVFFTLNEALAYAGEMLAGTATIRMLVDYMMPATDALVIPSGYNITLATSNTSYTGSGAASITRAAGFTGTPMFTNYGTLTLGAITIDGASVSTQHAMVKNQGTLNVNEGATLQNAKGTGNGGAILSTAGSVNLSGGTIRGNEAVWGAAVYASGGDVNLSGGAVEGNSAQSGGAIYYSGNGALNITDGSVSNNTVTGGNGGAVYVGGGTVNLSGGTIEGNSATSGSGGAIYATSALIAISDDASVQSNSAQSGGAIYAENGTITLSGGSVADNCATDGSGGGIYIGTGSITVSGGSMSGNAAGGNGGAIYADTATVNLNSGSLTGNEAENGSAVFVNAGTAYFTGGSITENIADNGGAVGIGGAEVKLNFTGAPVLTGNTMAGGAPSNLYLDVDSDAVINTTGLDSGANIGIYVPGAFTDDLFKHRGEAGASFASYPTSTVANMTCFKNDRLPDLTVTANSDARKLVWGKALAFEVRYLASYQNGLPPIPALQPKYTNNAYYPTYSANVVSELAAEMYTLFASKLSGTAAFGGAFLEGDTAYENFITEVNWDSTTQKWQFVRRDGSTVTDKKLILYYAEPAYITIENNTEHKLTVSELTVLGNSAFNSRTEAGYGYVVARNGATEAKLLPIEVSDLALEAGQSIKLLFPGAVNQNYELSGKFASPAGDIPFTRTGTAAGTISESEAGNGFTLNGKTLNTNGGVLEIKFGGDKPICKIVTEPIDSVADSEIAGSSVQADGKVEYTFSTLKQAMTFIQAHSLTTATVEMLIDYLIPASDVVILPQGYNITLTTATDGTFQYQGNGADGRATISRDSGNLQSIISRTAGNRNMLTIENLNFDGKSLVGNINGGVIKTVDCNVTLSNVDFVNCIANNGGGVYIEFSGTAGNNNGSLTAENVVFRNCRAKSTSSRQGGGAIWTDAATLELSNCQFINCTAYDQGGAVFHRVDGNYETHTTMQNCLFENCEAQAAGAFESDAKYVTVTGSTFTNCIATDRNGGGINIYSVNSAGPAANVGSTAVISGCSFENCHAYNTSANGFGGGLRSTAVTTTVTDCSFNNCTSRVGGAIAVSNSNATGMTVTGTSISNCSAVQQGGGIYSTALTVNLGKSGEKIDTVIQNCTSVLGGGGIWHEKSGATSSITLEKTEIKDCVATGGPGGALQTKSRTVSLVGCSVLDNSASGNGGGVNCTDGSSMLTIDACKIQGNQSGGMGGGIYQPGQMTLRNGSQITGNQLTSDTAGNAAGVYLNNMLTVGTADAAEPDTSSIVGNLTVNRTPSDLRMRVNGSNNHTQSVSVLCDLSGKIYVVNASARGTQFGSSSIAYPAGFADLDHVFMADDGSLYGIIDRSDANGKKIIWCTQPVCKITDERGRLLYFDAAGTSPMIFDKLDNGNDGTRDRATAFGFLRNTGARFYYKNGTEYIGDSFAVKMLVETYEQTKTIIVNNSARKIIFTTAGTADSDGYPYTGRAGSRATIIRANGLGNNRQMTVSSNLSFQNITIDGGSLRGITPTGNTKIIFANNANANITLGVGATLQNSSTSGNGGAVEMNNSAKLTIAGGMIRNCSANKGGGVYLDHANCAVNLTAGSITLCTADGTDGTGGGICVNKGTLNMSGGSITRCSAILGGGVSVATERTLNMSGGSITGNTATQRGGGIGLTGTSNPQKTKLNFSGLVNVSGNTVNGAANNLELNFDTNAIINSQGLYRGSMIGVYVPDGETLFDKHGNEGDPFGSYTGDNTYLYCFTNDRNGLKGGLISAGQPNTIYWVIIFSLEVSKRVVSDNPMDTIQSFEFTVTLGGSSDNNPSFLGSDVNGVYSDDEDGKMNFTNGVAIFTLKNGDRVTANNLPAGFTYTVEENLTSEQLDHYKVLPSRIITGKIGENLNDEDVEFKYLSKAAFTNLHAVCKITAPINGGTLLYYKNADDEYTPAVYSSLYSAFQTVNASTLYYWDVYSDLWKPYTGAEHQVELLVPEYTMTVPISVNSGKTVTLTTASAGAQDGYPYVGSGVAKVTRDFESASMFTANGSLTVTNIDLNGAGASVSGNGGIVNVAANGALTVTDGAVLRNGVATGAGGAVYVADNGSMTVSGNPSITNNTAAQGAGIYLATNGVLRIQNSPSFSGNYASVNPYTGKKNGGDAAAYNDGLRQDIYLANASTGNAPNIVVTGNLTGGDGSVWVFAESANHYKKNDQFAIMDGGPYSVTAFRNAQDDETTGNTSSSAYLTGKLKRGDSTNVYWGIPNTGDLAVTKTITGELGDITETFNFTLSGLVPNEVYTYTSYTSSDGASFAKDETGTMRASDTGTIVFTLGHYRRVVVESLPLNEALTLTEDRGNYTVTWTTDDSNLSDVSNVTNGRSFKLAGDAEIPVNNNLPAIAPSGLSMATAPYIWMAVAGALLLAGRVVPAYLKKRRRGNMDQG